MSSFHRVETFESTASGVSATSSEIVEMQASRIAFEKASTIEELQELTVAFLRGDLTATAYNLGSADIPTSFVESLIALNKKGFITTGCQAGSMETHRNEIVQKRFWVEGIVQRRYFTRFVREMYIRFGNRVFLAIQDADRSFEEIHDLTKNDLYSVMRVGNQAVQHIPEVTGPCQMFQTCDEVYPQLVEEYVSVFILGTEWCESGADLLVGMSEIMEHMCSPRKNLPVPKLPTLVPKSSELMHKCP